MDDQVILELSEVIQSSNINFLIGAGVSTPFLPMLGNIEKALNEAKNDAEREIQYKKYFDEVMKPNKRIIDEDLSNDPDYTKTITDFENFFKALTNILLCRKSNILSKQINIFTTNIDILMEVVLEQMQLGYNDGFFGKFKPIFSLANYKKSLSQRSLHFEHISEIPTFNIIKMHGSLTWKYEDDNENVIVFSHALEHFDNNLSGKMGTDFLKDYKKILVVNPEESKHLLSVLNLYYSELLRMYSCELEKETATLFILGFSLEDTHIKEITLRAAKANPTLRIFIYCSKSREKILLSQIDLNQYPNIKIFTPTDTSKYNLELFTKDILEKIGK